jgi:hypothetical protein
MSETLCVSDYECSYVGNVPLAKSYGLQPVYHVRWSHTMANKAVAKLLSERRQLLPFIPSAASSTEHEQRSAAGTPAGGQQRARASSVDEERRKGPAPSGGAGIGGSAVLRGSKTKVGTSPPEPAAAIAAAAPGVPAH